MHPKVKNKPNEEVFWVDAVTEADVHQRLVHAGIRYRYQLSKRGQNIDPEELEHYKEVIWERLRGIRP